MFLKLFQEIMLGILGNLACQTEIRDAVSKRESLIELLIASLNYHDAPALIQLVRLIRSCLWELRNRDQKAKIEDDLWTKCLSQEESSANLSFIIQSSVEGWSLVTEITA
jgi:hypothetical protein